MAIKGTVVFVEARGKAVRVGARSEDGLMWFWTTTGPAPCRGQVVDIPPGAKPEPYRRNGSGFGKAPARPEAPHSATRSEEALPEDVARVLRAVALKAAAAVYSGHGTSAVPLALQTAEQFLAWLNEK